MFDCFGRAKRIEEKIDTLTWLVHMILRREKAMGQELDALIAQVAETASTEQSAIIAIQGLIQKLVDAQGDPAKIAELTAELKEKTDALAAAIVAVPA